MKPHKTPAPPTQPPRKAPRPSGNLQAAADQLGAAMASMAPAIRQFHLSLTSQGFSEDQAIRLTAEALPSLLRGT